MATPKEIERAVGRVADQPTFLQSLLAGALGWRIPDRIEQVQDVAYGWSAADLRAAGLDQRLVDGHAWQIQVQTQGQPWGIFLLEFRTDAHFTARGGLTGATGTLRKLLRGLVPSRRRDPSLRHWDREHLLFICTHNYRQFRFAYFKAPKDGAQLSPLASFGWNQGDAHVRTLCDYNLPALAFPDDDGADPVAWVKKWAGAFDVEAVTKRFFAEYRQVFEKVEAGVKGVPNGESRRLYVQRLFNRLMFLYFIQRKGWLSFQGDKHYLRALFTAATGAKEDFLNERLYWTFFAGLNTLMEDQALHAHVDLKARRGEVPFLNGGLFDLEDEYDVQDTVRVPNAAFAAVLDLFERYNFTVTESTPLDIEVAVDPEMLGKVFEELVTGRHETGSYYTPRPIVAFMCREALKHYLAANVADEAAVARFVDDGDPTGLPDPEAVLDALRAVKVCDPACGSGAYLLGMMQELLRLREALFATRGLDAITVYKRKLEIIQNNLYGVDIDLFAVNIAKLRLWLSLAVDYAGDKPPPLPNLDFKIECGDSLAAPDPQEIPDLFRALLVGNAEGLAVLKGQFLSTYGAPKKMLEKSIKAEEAKLRESLHDSSAAGVVDWRVAFAEVFKDGGFHVVLANPPYISAIEFSRSYPEEYRQHLNSQFICAKGAYDIFVLFFERAIQCLVQDGVLCFITPNKYLSAKYAKDLRAFLLQKCSLLSIVDISGIPVFATVSVYPVLSLIQKKVNACANVLLLHPRVRDLPAFDLQNYVRSSVPSPLLRLLPENIWGFLLSNNTALLIRLVRDGSPLQELGKVNATTTAAEADEYGTHLVERPRKIKTALKVVNTGTIDAYQSLWGVARMTHAGSRYLTPYIDARILSEQRRELYGSPKVLFAKLAKSCEAFLDGVGEYASLNTNCFHTPKNDVSLEYVCAFCNSSVFAFLYEQFFGALRMSGGYYQFQAPQLKVIPLRRISPANQKPFVEIVRRIQKAAEDENGSSDKVMELRHRADEKFFELYGLSDAEIAVVQKSLGQ